MRKKRQTRPSDANVRLPAHLNEEFIRDFSFVLSRLSAYGEPKAIYQEKYWLTKYCKPLSSAGKMRRDRAISKWLDTEARIASVNTDICENHEPIDILRCTVDRFLTLVKKEVTRVIGETPKLDPAIAGYSGGASTSKRRKDGHPAIKYLRKADMTSRAHAYLILLAGTAYGDWLCEPGLEPRIVDASVMFTVPKSSDIDRVAAKEPDLNVYFQKMLGNEIRARLKKVGINLNDQSINGNLARYGSLSGTLATVDLSSASDSVSFELVKRVLPTGWFEALHAFRTDQTILPDGTVHTLQLFSTMGNGFTFELESLIFYSICRVVTRRMKIKGPISVYGDDIIVPVEAYEPLCTALNTCGFIVNDAKSFHEGHFRESCGTYWYRGMNVKPFYLRGPLTKLTDLIHTLNALLEWGSDGLGVLDPRYEPLWSYYARFVPSNLHGGQDLSTGYALVTGDSPRCELRPIVKSYDVQHIGGFLQWLQVTASRREARYPVGITGTVSRDYYRVKRYRGDMMQTPVILNREVYDQLSLSELKDMIYDGSSLLFNESFV